MHQSECFGKLDGYIFCCVWVHRDHIREDTIYLSSLLNEVISAIGTDTKVFKQYQSQCGSNHGPN